MLAMVLVATALTRFTLAHTGPISDENIFSRASKKVYIEEDMTPEFSEQLYRHEHDNDRIPREDRLDKYGPAGLLYIPPSKSKRNSITAEALKNLIKHRIEALKVVPIGPKPAEEHKKRAPHGEDTMDVVDREDHVTQYLAELLVNTDSEITSLEASENEDERAILEVKEDTFFAFLTGLEKIMEVDGALSKPPADDEYHDDKEEKKVDYIPNIVIDDN